MPAERLARRKHPVVRQAAAPPVAKKRLVGPTGIALITVAAILRQFAPASASLNGAAR